MRLLRSAAGLVRVTGCVYAKSSGILQLKLKLVVRCTSDSVQQARRDIAEASTYVSQVRTVQGGGCEDMAIRQPTNEIAGAHAAGAPVVGLVVMTACRT